MRTRKLRFLSALLAVAMMFMLTPTAAFADAGLTSGGTQTEEVEVTVTSFETGKLAEAVKAKAAEQNTTIDKITTLTISGGTLNDTDFDVLRGGHLIESGIDPWDSEQFTKPTNQDAVSYLSGLKKLDLSDARCVEDALPTCALAYSNIETVILPSTLKGIGINSLYQMKHLSYVGINKSGNAGDDITFPASLETIGFCAFYGDEKLTGKLILPSNVKLGSSAFSGTSVCGDITITADTLQPSAKGGDNSSTFRETKINSVTFTGGKIPEKFGMGTHPSSIKIADGVTEIGNQAFDYIYQKPVGTQMINTIVIPKSVTSIGSRAFTGLGQGGSIIVQNPEVEYKKTTDGHSYAFNNLTNTKIYVSNDLNSDIWNSSSYHFGLSGGYIPTNADGNVSASAEKNYGDTTVYEPVKDGYTFAGWYWWDSTNSKSVKLEATDVPATGVYYNAHWNKLHTVTFAYGEADLTDTTEQVAEGSTVTKPEDPKANGYKFEGWYKDKNCDEEFKFDTETIASDTTIYAKWHKYSVNLTTEEKPNTTEPDAKTYVDQPVEIDVNVTAGIADLAAIAKASLIFDDATAVEKVEVNGKELTDYTDIDIATLLGNTQPDQQEPQSIALLSEENANSTLENVPATATLSITFNKAGEHSVTIQLKDSADNTIATQTTQVKVYSKSEPAPEEKTAKLTFTDDCTAELEDGTPIESGKQVKAGEKVTLKLVESKVPEGMKFDAYVIDPIPADGKLTVNGTTATFEMTEKDTSVKVNFVTTDTEDSGWDAATIVTGVAIGAGTAVLAYHIGTEVYAEQILGKGVAIPRTRADVALTAWQLAGKPEVAIEGEPLSEAAMAQKWAVESGLMQNDADGSFNPEKKMSKLKALKVLDAAKKMG